MSKKLFYFWIIPAFLSCSSQIDIELLTNGEATVTITTGLKDYFLAYWKDLRELEPSLPASPIDPENIRKNLQIRPEVRQLNVRTQGLTNLTSFRLSSWIDLLKRDLENQTGNVSTTSLDIPLKLSLFVPVDSDIASQIVAPNLSAQEIEKELAATLQDYTSEAVEAVRSSRIAIKIRTPRPIRNTNGNRSSDQRSASWDFSLAQLFSGNRRIVISW